MNGKLNFTITGAAWQDAVPWQNWRMWYAAWLDMHKGSTWDTRKGCRKGRGK